MHLLPKEIFSGKSGKKTKKNYSQVFRGKEVFVEPNRGRFSAQYIGNIFVMQVNTKDNQGEFFGIFFLYTIKSKISADKFSASKF